DAMRERGVSAGLHTYSQFLNGASKFVSPTPHPDLATMAEWTLAADLSADADAMTVAESTADVSTVTGFFVRNSLYLWIDDELIRFGEPSKTAPFGFSACERGALGTRATAHAAGAKVRQMTHMFNLFVPKAGSELMTEVARETARTYNEGGFASIYFDALDGTISACDDRELIWYYDALFVAEVVKNCVEPPLVEYSTMSAAIWIYRSRMGAWDSASRGYRRFFTEHFANNEWSADAVFLPGQIGWLALAPTIGDTAPGFQKHTLFTEDVEFLGAKTLAHNYGYSVLGMNLGSTQPGEEANGAILARYDKLRRAGTLSASALEKMCDPALDFALVAGPDGDAVAPANYERFEIADEETALEFDNPNAAQIPYVRVENRYQTGDYAAPSAVELVPFAPGESVEAIKTAKFDPPLDLSKNLALGMWITGDGGGQKVNIRVESPSHLSGGHLDHFATLDFVGRRYVSFAEAENGLEPPVEWPKACGDIYAEYREGVHYDAVSEVDVMVVGDTSGLKFETLKAVELVPCDLAAPAIEIGGKTVNFDVEIPSGHYLEFDPRISRTTAFLRDPAGNALAEVPVADAPTLPAGKSRGVFKGLID
ncbi:MAG: hypothetical protein HUK22_08160, partial [Thermoguttaceae bacterium]|nr:hypothetical protein [Thermoguttaceae bacterium]